MRLLTPRCALGLLLLAAVAILGPHNAAAQILHPILNGGSVPPMLDIYPSPAPQAAYGVIKLRSAYSGASLRLALGSSTSTQEDIPFVSKVTNGVSEQVANDATAQSFLTGSSTYGWVAKWYDQSGSSYDATADSVGADSPLYKGITANNLPSGVNATPALREWLGFPSLSFAARNAQGGSGFYLNLPAGVATNRQNISVIMATTVNDERESGVSQIQQELSVFGSTSLFFTNYHGTLQFSNNSTLIDSTVNPRVDWHVVGFTLSATQACVYDDLISNCVSNTYTANAQGGGTISSSSASYDGMATAYLVWGTALSATQMQQRIAALKSQLGISATPKTEIVFDGDSFGEGYFGSYNEHHVQRAIERIFNDTGKRVAAYNVSIGGTCVGLTSGCTSSPQTMTSRFSTYTGPLLSLGSYSKRILYMMGGTNDIGSAGASTTAGYVSTYFSNALTAVPGIAEVYGGIISRSGVDATIYTAMQDIVTGSPAFSVTGWYADTHMGSVSGGGTNYANATYFDSDEIHPVNLGHDVGSQYDATTIEPLVK